ncbi:MAG: hypothetical protein RO009_12985 [Pseudorhodoplanes sp.]|jgi:hypothetical protein|nr:hypothetical protein [Pseudorhodoplanes sp.]
MSGTHLREVEAVGDPGSLSQMFAVTIMIMMHLRVGSVESPLRSGRIARKKNESFLFMYSLIFGTLEATAKERYSFP